jgi:hypothetical protein
MAQHCLPFQVTFSVSAQFTVSTGKKKVGTREANYGPHTHAGSNAKHSREFQKHSSSANISETEHRASALTLHVSPSTQRFPDFHKPATPRSAANDAALVEYCRPGFTTVALALMVASVSAS